MIDFLEKTDHALFLLLNGWHSPFWDQVMWQVSGIWIWIPLYLFILAWLVKIYKRRFWVLLLFVILLIVLSDQASVHLFKDVFRRLRPCHNEALAPLVHLIHGHCGGLYSFVSSHAANIFAVATFSSLLIRKRLYTILIFMWALLIGYSRVYLGVHFPGDVLGGAVLGILTGWFVVYLFRKTDRRWMKKSSFFIPPGDG